MILFHFVRYPPIVFTYVSLNLSIILLIAYHLSVSYDAIDWTSRQLMIRNVGIVYVRMGGGCGEPA